MFSINEWFFLFFRRLFYLWHNKSCSSVASLVCLATVFLGSLEYHKRPNKKEHSIGSFLRFFSLWKSRTLQNFVALVRQTETANGDSILQKEMQLLCTMYVLWRTCVLHFHQCTFIVKVSKWISDWPEGYVGGCRWIFQMHSLKNFYLLLLSYLINYHSSICPPNDKKCVECNAKFFIINFRNVFDINAHIDRG